MVKRGKENKMDDNQKPKGGNGKRNEFESTMLKSVLCYCNRIPQTG